MTLPRDIWRLDERAHLGGGHYVRADQGDDVTVICTGEWLVQTDLDQKVERVNGRKETAEPLIAKSHRKGTT